MKFLLLVIVVVAVYVLFFHKFNVNGIEYKGWIAKNKAEKEGNAPAGYDAPSQIAQQNTGRGTSYDDKRMGGSTVGVSPAGNDDYDQAQQVLDTAQWIIAASSSAGNDDYDQEQQVLHGVYYTFAIKQPSPEKKLDLVKALVDNKILLGFGTDFGLKEAKDFVDSIPAEGDKIVIENVREDDFEAIKNVFLGLVAFSVTKDEYE